MSASIDFTNAAAFRAYMETFSSDLIHALFHGFETASLITPHEGVKGQKILTQSIISDLIQRWQKSFDPTDDAIQFVPRILQVVEAKVDIQIYPQEFEQTYLAFARRPGFNHLELPFAGFILMQLFAKMQEELEDAIWQGVATGSPAGGDLLAVMIDGFLHLIADAITATDINPVVTGAVSNTNAVAAVEAVYKSLLPAYKKNSQVDVLVSLDVMEKYLEDSRERYGKYVGQRGEVTDVIKLDHGRGFVRSIAGMGSSQRIIATPRNNLHYGYDLAMDWSSFSIQEIHRSIDIMGDFKIGCQVGLMQDGVIAVNDQA